MKNIKFLSKFLVVALVFTMVASVMTGCGDSSSDTIKIGFIGPLTGDVSEYGITCLNGAKLYVEEINAKGGINGKLIEFIEKDDKGSATEAVNCYEALMSENVVAILGAVTSTPTIAVAQKAAADGIPMMTPTATQSEVTTYGNHMFRACFLDPYQGQTMSNFAYNELGAKTAAIIYNRDDAYSEGLYSSFQENAAAIGLKVADIQSYGKDDADFTAQLTAIKTTNPDVLFIPDYYNNVYKIASAAKAAGITATLIGVDGADGVLSIDGADGSVLEGMYYANHYSTDDPSEIVQNFLTSYKNTYKDAVSAFSALGYDGMYILCAALQNVVDGGTELTADTECWNKIIAALDATDIDCVTGHVTYDENNNPNKTCAIIKIVKVEADGNDTYEYSLYKKY